MKKLIIIAILFFGLGQIATAQSQSDVVTDSFKVYGNCGDCKERIEEAAYGKGVKKATWDKDTKILVLIYKPSKTNTKDVAKRIAAVGHDAGEEKADQKKYDKLPGCCKYRDQNCSH